MRILIIGLGSMGKRRIRNLLKLGYSDIIGFDTREDRRKETIKKYNIKIISNVDDAFEKKPDIMIISTPPDLHLKYANLAIKNGINFFTEVNLLSKDLIKIIKKAERRSILAYPSCTMRFHPVVKELKKILDRKLIGKVLTVFHHTGQYLPYWHPWEDYRKFFVSKRETGGARELVPVELVWLTFLFSEIKSVYAKVDKISNLDADIDDIYQIMLEFKNKVLCILLTDVVSIPPIKETRITGENGTIFCNFNEGIIKIYKQKKWHIIKIKMDKAAIGYKGNTPPESLYEEEIRSFLNAIAKKGRYPHTLHDELKLLHVLDAAEKSSKSGKKLILN